LLARFLRRAAWAFIIPAALFYSMLIGKDGNLYPGTVSRFAGYPVYVPGSSVQVVAFYQESTPLTVGKANDGNYYVLASPTQQYVQGTNPTDGTDAEYVVVQWGLSPSLLPPGVWQAWLNMQAADPGNPGVDQGYNPVPASPPLGSALGNDATYAGKPVGVWHWEEQTGSPYPGDQIWGWTAFDTDQNYVNATNAWIQTQRGSFFTGFIRPATILVGGTIAAAAGAAALAPELSGAVSGEAAAAPSVGGALADTTIDSSLVVPVADASDVVPVVDATLNPVAAPALTQTLSFSDLNGADLSLLEGSSDVGAITPAADVADVGAVTPLSTPLSFSDLAPEASDVVDAGAITPAVAAPAAATAATGAASGVTAAAVSAAISKAVAALTPKPAAPAPVASGAKPAVAGAAPAAAPQGSALTWLAVAALAAKFL
jgi:hypothetical protein